MVEVIIAALIIYDLSFFVWKIRDSSSHAVAVDPDLVTLDERDHQECIGWERFIQND